MKSNHTMTFLGICTTASPDSLHHIGVSGGIICPPHFVGALAPATEEGLSG
jgi:hypothetical protein